MHMVFITEGFLEVAIESWPEWDLNPRPLNSVQNLVAIKLRVLIVNTKQIYYKMWKISNYSSTYVIQTPIIRKIT